METLKKIGLTALALLPLSVMAHPGHGAGNPLSPGHYVISPEHNIQISLVIAATAIIVIWALNRRKNTAR